jgi:hypothetical protein
MLGADVGTALMAVVFSFDLSWLSPLLIFAGVVMFISRQNTTVRARGRVLIGLGLITLALQLIVGATKPLTAAPAVRALLVALPNEVLLDIVVGAVLALLSYSSLAIVLLAATLAAQGMLPATVALGLVLGANVGSGVLAMIVTSGQARGAPPAAGQLLFKLGGALIFIPLLGQACTPSCSSGWARCTSRWCCSTWASTRCWRCSSSASPARWRAWSSAAAHADPRRRRRPPRHLDPVALATPSAGHQLRRARGAAPGRRGGDHAARRAAGDARQRPGPGRTPAPDGRHRRRAVLGHQVLPDADLARGAVRARGPALDRHRQLHHQHGADRRQHRTRAAGHRGQEDPQEPQLQRRRHGRDLPPARAPAEPTCAWA